MKRILSKLLKASSLAALALMMVSCGNPSNGGAGTGGSQGVDPVNPGSGENPNGQIVITDAKSLAKALECDLSVFVYEEPSTSRAVIGEDKQNQVKIDVNTMLKGLICTNAGYMIYNTIADSSDKMIFDEEISLNITKAPENLKVMFETTGLSEAFYIQLFNTAKVKMHKYSDTEFGIDFQYTRDFGNEISTINSFVYVDASSSDKLVTWYMQKSKGSGIVVERSERIISKDKNSMEIKMLVGEDNLSYLKVGNTNKENYYEQASLRSNTLGLDAVFKDSKGYYWSMNGDELYYGFSKTNPSVIALKGKIKEGNPLDYNYTYFNTCYLSNKDDDGNIYSGNYYTYVHSDDSDNGINYNFSTHPLYYSANELFYGVTGSVNDLTDDAKALCSELSETLTAKKSADYSSYKMDMEERAKIINQYNVSYPES